MIQRKLKTLNNKGNDSRILFFLCSFNNFRNRCVQKVESRWGILNHHLLSCLFNEKYSSSLFSKLHLNGTYTNKINNTWNCYQKYLINFLGFLRVIFYRTLFQTWKACSWVDIVSSLLLMRLLPSFFATFRVTCALQYCQQSFFKTKCTH